MALSGHDCIGGGIWVSTQAIDKEQLGFGGPQHGVRHA